MKVYPVFIPHAGCPHRCLFCAQDRTTGRADAPSADEVCAWLDATLPPQGAGEVAFFGGTFAQLPLDDQNAYLAAAGRYVSAGRVAGIRISTRPDSLVDLTLERLRAAGVTTVELGCQSFSDAVLVAAGRGHTSADNAAAVRLCRAAGLATGVQLMPGLPCGDAAEALDSLHRALTLGPSFVRIYPAVVLEGTVLARLWRDGRYAPWSLEAAVETCADMLRLCRLAGVPVVRLGLQGDPALETGLLAGPWHPAFGQLVRARLWRRALQRAALEGRRASVHPADLSDAVGHRGANREWLAGRGTPLELVADRGVARGRLRIADGEYQLEALSAHGGHHG